jgi:retron-type reverse transcriptase
VQWTFTTYSSPVSRRTFDRVSHEHLKRFLAHRITDPRLLRIIDRFRKTGGPGRAEFD